MFPWKHVVLLLVHNYLCHKSIKCKKNIRGAKPERWTEIENLFLKCYNSSILIPKALNHNHNHNFICRKAGKKGLNLVWWAMLYLAYSDILYTFRQVRQGRVTVLSCMKCVLHESMSLIPHTDPKHQSHDLGLPQKIHCI
jgi:hypothetical protein